MPKFSVDRAHARLTAEGGLPLFLLADDVRGATVRAALPDWNDYLAIRAKQGFNAVLVDAMRSPEQLDRMAELIEVAEKHAFFVLAWREGAVAQAGPETPRVLCGSAEEDVNPEEADLLLRLPLHNVGRERSLPEVALLPADVRNQARAKLWPAILGGSFGGVVCSVPGLSGWDDPNAGLANPCAEDFVFAKQAVDYFDLTWGEPWNEALVEGSVCSCARTSSTALVYVPEPCEVKLLGDFSETFVQAIDLTSGEGSRLDFVYDGEVSAVPEHPFAEDALYVIRL